MHPRLLAALALALALGSAPALAGQAPEPEPPGAGQDPDNSHVHKNKPWKAKFTYQVIRQAHAYAELNSRSDVVAEVQKDQWWPIDCQLVNTTQRGVVIWDHIPNVGWVTDHNLKTFTDGQLEGAPACADPTGTHVWFEQPWAADKQYRLKRDSVVRTRPGGAVNPLVSLPKGLWTPIQCSAATGRKTWIRLSSDGKGSEGWINVKALKLWQKGLPAGLPGCVSQTQRRFVVLGDSYASGIGAGSYYEDSVSCYQSAQSYWAVLSTRLAPGLTTARSDFEACTGDTTSDLRGKLAYVLNADTALATVSIGGNDMGFSTVIRRCIKPGPMSCKKAVDKAFTQDKLDALRTKLAATYDEIRALAPNAGVLVIGYPRLVPNDHIDNCGAMDDGDAEKLTNAAATLNETIRSTVAGRKKFRFVGLYKAFKDHPACNKGSEDWINAINTMAGGMASFHPNVPGNLAIAEAIADAAPRYFG